ncbi:MAG TPA: histidine kinase, partial [Cyanobacteria bacterium UBA11148]|nr:histidine kinase [Cyanobacteria bacterium UBA11148]
MQARGDEIIRVIVRLGSDQNNLKLDVIDPPLEPKQFSSYEAYRQALIDHRKSQIVEVVGDTIEELENLSLKPLGGGKLTPIIVVEGSPEKILRALELPGVHHATLDRLIALPGIATDAAIDYIANLYIKLLHRSVDKDIEELIFQASEQYIINYHKCHNKLQVLGMQKPVDLDSIYTSVQFLPPSNSWQFESIEALQQVYRQTGKHELRGENLAKQEGITVANQEQYLMVLGAPGAGKSTFLRKIGLEALKGKSGVFQHECIPVFIELKQFNNNDINIVQAIAQEFRIVQLPLADEFTANALHQGKLLILLDGLDEVPTDNIDLVISQIQEFVEEYPKNRFIYSCRTAVYRRNFERFRAVAIADFDDTQIQQFIQNWFSSEIDTKAGTADKCWELLKQSTSTKELAKTPLLLTFLCLVYDDSQDFPKNRATLYSDALDILLKKWAAEKRLQNNPIYRELGIDLEKIMLSEIAYRGFEADRLFFSRQEAVRQIQDSLASNENAPKHLDADDVLDAIAIQQGILVERSRDIYSFSHLTLQEYLTAKYINDHRILEKLVAEHLADKRWREVFLLVAGLMGGGADELLLLMEKEAQKYINSSKLKALLEWADWVTDGSEGDMKPVGKRAVGIAHANAIANYINHNNTNSNTIINPIANLDPKIIANIIVNIIVNTNGIGIVAAYADAYTIVKIIDNAHSIADADTMFNAMLNAMLKGVADADTILQANPI